MKQRHGLFTPLLHVSCTTSGDAPLHLHHFNKTEWVEQHGNDGYRASFPIDGDCTKLRACAALPAGPVGCGGYPERCTEFDLLPAIAQDLERATPPQLMPLSNASLSVEATRGHSLLF